MLQNFLLYGILESYTTLFNGLSGRIFVIIWKQIEML